MTAPVLQVVRTDGRGRQPAAVEATRDAVDEVAALHAEALAFIDAARPLTHRLELALEAIMLSDESSHPIWRHLHNIAAGLNYELDRYERRHLPDEPAPLALEAAA